MPNKKITEKTLAQVQPLPELGGGHWPPLGNGRFGPAAPLPPPFL
jgi:hypothetical protein